MTDVFSDLPEERQPIVSEREIQDALCQRHGAKIQEKLNAGRVAIAGLGGLGSNVAFALARIGVGHLHLVDYDRVDITNLNRQQYFIRHIGRYKTDALREELREINPYLDIRADCVKVTEENLAGLFEEEDIICEAFDVPECKAMLVNGVLEKLPGKKLVAASGMAGYGNSNAIRTRKALRNFYLCGDEASGSVPGNGLMAPRVALCAAHEANIIVKLLIQEDI